MCDLCGFDLWCVSRRPIFDSADGVELVLPARQLHAAGAAGGEGVVAEAARGPSPQAPHPTHPTRPAIPLLLPRRFTACTRPSETAPRLRRRDPLSRSRHVRSPCFAGTKCAERTTCPAWRFWRLSAAERFSSSATDPSWSSGRRSSVTSTARRGQSAYPDSREMAPPPHSREPACALRLDVTHGMQCLGFARSAAPSASHRQRSADSPRAPQLLQVQLPAEAHFALSCPPFPRLCPPPQLRHPVGPVRRPSDGLLPAGRAPLRRLVDVRVLSAISRAGVRRAAPAVRRHEHVGGGVAEGARDGGAGRADCGLWGGVHGPGGYRTDGGAAVRGHRARVAVRAAKRSASALSHECSWSLR